MRVCFKCGHKDYPIWKHKRFRLYTCYCHIDELRIWEPSLAELIEREHDVKVAGYIYHLTKAGYVDRIHESDSKDGVSWREPEQQKHYNFLVHGRQTLEAPIQ